MNTNQPSEQERREILIKAHRLANGTRVDFSSPDVNAQIEKIAEAADAAHRLGPLTRKELEEAGVVTGNGFTNVLWYVMSVIPCLI